MTVTYSFTTVREFADTLATCCFGDTTPLPNVYDDWLKSAASSRGYRITAPWRSWTRRVR
ncbi:MAG: hypothetical protein ACE5JL_15305 [Dehalococcoidia bacterium]